MAFLNSWAIGIGVLAATLPVLIHWLTRPKPVVRPLSTIRFVLQAVRQRRARHRLRDFVILSLRTLAVLLLALTIARPILDRHAGPPVDDEGETLRIVLLDTSQSLSARSGGIEAFERARSLAATQLAYRPGLSANLVLAGAAPRAVFDRPSSNFGALRDELGRANPRPERIDVQAALNLAARLLAKAGAGKKRLELIIDSDFQRSQWASADFSVLPRETDIRLESVASETPPVNLAVLRVGGPGRIERGSPSTIEVELGNFSRSSRPVEVELTVGEDSYRLEGSCPPQARTVLSAEITPRAVGWLEGKVRLLGANDALPEDDARPFAVEVRTPPTYALLTRQSPRLVPSSSYFLQLALVPSEPRDDQPSARIVRFDPAQLDREALAASDLVVLDHPGRLPDDLLTPLVGSLRRGRGMLYVASEPADATNLKRIADLAGADLRLPVEFAPPTDGGPRAPRFIADFRRDSSPFAVFGDEATAVVSPLRFVGGLVSRSLPDALSEDIRATYGDRSACLVVSTCGAGTLAILNADLGASNLPASPVFVPLLGELTTPLLGRRGIGVPVVSGEPFAIPLPADAGPVAGLKVMASREFKPDSLEIVEEPEGPVFRFDRRWGAGRGSGRAERLDGVRAGVGPVRPGERPGRVARLDVPRSPRRRSEAELSRRQPARGRDRSRVDLAGGGVRRLPRGRGGRLEGLSNLR